MLSLLPAVTSAMSYTTIYLRFIQSVCLLLLFFAQAATAALDARLDRMEISETETVRLYITADSDSQGASPDLTPLAQDFDVLGNAQSVQIQNINGQQSASTTWTITLAPKKSGIMEIPPLPVGKEFSPALPLKVKSAAVAKVDKNSTQALPDVFLEVSIAPQTAYVQSQLIYTVKLFHALSLRSASLTPPNPQNAQVQKLGDDVSYETQLQNRHYRVVEQNYAIFPEQSGTLEIPPLVLQGTTIAPNQNRSQSRLSPFGDLFDMDSSMQPLHLRSEAQTATIKPRPAEFLGDDWLPAMALVLQDNWSQDPPTFRVGEPITRTLILQAQGLRAEQLPDIEQHLPSTLEAYPETAQRQSIVQDKNPIGQWQQKIALRPTQAGHFTLPAIELAWWDTQQQKTRIARLPERQIEVLPAAANPHPAAATLPAVPTPPPVLQPALSGGAEPVVVTQVSAGYYPWLSAALGIAWLITLLLWRFSTLPLTTNAVAQQSPSPQRRAALKSLEAACQANQAAAARQAVLDWAQACWAQPFYHLGAVSAYLADSNAKSALVALERQLYGTQREKTQWDGRTFWLQVRPALRASQASQAVKTVLTPLYPLG